jgi:hypothetical protein
MPGLHDKDGVSKYVSVETSKSLKERELAFVFIINKYWSDSLKTKENQEGSKEDIHLYLEKTRDRYNDQFINVG